MPHLMNRDLKRARLAACLLPLAALACVSTAGAVDPTQMPTPELQARYQGLTHELRCVQCQDEALADSPAGIASDLRGEVRDMLLAGKSDDDVRNFMLARYGDFVLFRPRFAWKNAWLWSAPEVLLIVGVLVAWRVVRKRARLVSADSEPLPDDGSP
ncbi:MAG TPA: cytochrome c-type biogenesis protein [Steroidobacteraceae bacterium]|nr:cytochrome c-type biogenesis protein [Steroidobacteraceae bacterium]